MQLRIRLFIRKPLPNDEKPPTSMPSKAAKDFNPASMIDAQNIVDSTYATETNKTAVNGSGQARRKNP